MFEGLLPSFLITLREALEAALIVVIAASYLKKVGRGELNRYAYSGSGVAVLLSAVLGWTVQVFYGELKGVSAELFEGIDSLAAVVVLTYMIFWMSNHAKKMKGELQDRIDVAITTGQLFSITTLAFVAVFREGLETVLFLTAIFFIDAVDTIIGVMTGTAIVLAIAVLLMKGTYHLDMRKFFRYTSLLLIIFAAGMAGYGVHEFVEAGKSSGIEFGFLGTPIYDINPPRNPDGTYPLLHESGMVGAILKALIGYDGNPEWLRAITSPAYWLIVRMHVLRTYRHPITTPNS